MIQSRLDAVNKYWEAPPMKQYKKFNAEGKYTGTVRNIAVNISIEDIMADAAEGLKRVSDEAGL